MNSAIRAFIAIELNAQLQSQLAEIIRQLKSPQTAAVRWVAAQNIHLTLKFLGEISTANLQMLTSRLQAEAQRHAPFEITVGGLGAFPNPRRPRVVWVGMQAPPALTSLQHGVENETNRLGYTPEDKPFSPHLTIGRVTNNADPAEVQQVAAALGKMTVGELGSVRVDAITLFRSDLQPTGAVYTVVYKAAMGK